MKNVKGIVEGFRNIFGNPKLKGVIQIIFWIVFFFIVAMIFRTSKVNNNVEKKDNKVDSKENIDTSVVNSYEYTYQYNDNTSMISTKGIHYNNKETFTMNNIKYYSIDNKYYNAQTKELANITYAIDEWSYNNIKSITDHNSYTNQTKYKNGKEVYEYTIDKNTYNNYYQKTYTNDINITITKENNVITEAIINYGFGTVTINYTNINEIDNLDINDN